MPRVSIFSSKKVIILGLNLIISIKVLSTVPDCWRCAVNFNSFLESLLLEQQANEEEKLIGKERKVNSWKCHHSWESSELPPQMGSPSRGKKTARTSQGKRMRLKRLGFSS